MPLGLQNFNYHISKKSRAPENTKTPGEDIRIDSTGNLHHKKRPPIPYLFIAADKTSRWPVVKTCKHLYHETVKTFLNVYINVYGVPKQLKSDKRDNFISSKEDKELCRSQNIDREYGPTNQHTGTGLVEQTIQSLKILILAKLENSTNLRENVNRAL